VSAWREGGSHRRRSWRFKALLESPFKAWGEFRAGTLSPPRMLRPHLERRPRSAEHGVIHLTRTRRWTPELRLLMCTQSVMRVCARACPRSRHLARRSAHKLYARGHSRSRKTLSVPSTNAIGSDLAAARLGGPMSARREGGGESVPGATLHLRVRHCISGATLHRSGCDTASRVRHCISGVTPHRSGCDTASFRVRHCLVPRATLPRSACDTASRMAADLRVTIKRAQFNLPVQRAGS
jgi:hypothetical protein